MTKDIINHVKSCLKCAAIQSTSSKTAWRIETHRSTGWSLAALGNGLPRTNRSNITAPEQIHNLRHRCPIEVRRHQSCEGLHGSNSCSVHQRRHYQQVRHSSMHSHRQRHTFHSINDGRTFQARGHYASLFDPVSPTDQWSDRTVQRNNGREDRCSVERPKNELGRTTATGHIQLQLVHPRHDQTSPLRNDVRTTGHPSVRSPERRRISQPRLKAFGEIRTVLVIDNPAGKTEHRPLSTAIQATLRFESIESIVQDRRISSDQNVETTIEIWQSIRRTLSNYSAASNEDVRGATCEETDVVSASDGRRHVADIRKKLLVAGSFSRKDPGRWCTLPATHRQDRLRTKSVRIIIKHCKARRQEFPLPTDHERLLLTNHELPLIIDLLRVERIIRTEKEISDRTNYPLDSAQCTEKKTNGLKSSFNTSRYGVIITSRH